MKDKQKLQAILFELLKYVLSFVVVAIIGAGLISFQGENPSVALKALWNGIFADSRAMGNAIRWVTPCLFTGAAAMVAFRSGVSNLGIEGQLYAGSLVAALVGYALPLPAHIHPIVCVIAGGLAGMLVAMIPALIKHYFNINEMITTLMLNYIVALVAEYIVVIVKGLSTTNLSKAMATPPILDSANSGALLALLVIAVLFLIYRYSVTGYEMKQVGDNQRFSTVGGVRVIRQYFAIFLISGLIAGFAGATEAVGVFGKYMPNSSKNLGWDGIMITLVGKNNPISVLIVSTLWGALKSGALTMELTTNTNRLTVELIQALFVLFVTVDYKMIGTKVSYFVKKYLKRSRKNAG